MKTRRESRKEFAKDFGKRILELRTKGQETISLRRIAEAIGVSATYMSEVERGVVSPPTEEKIRAIAEFLGADADELIALAGRVPQDVQEILRENPTGISALLRALKGQSAEGIRLVQEWLMIDKDDRPSRDEARRIHESLMGDKDDRPSRDEARRIHESLMGDKDSGRRK